MAPIFRDTVKTEIEGEIIRPQSHVTDAGKLSMILFFEALHRVLLKTFSKLPTRVRNLYHSDFVLIN